MDQVNEEDLTKIVVDYYDDFFEVGGEGLWARSLGSDLYEIHNSPWHNTFINYLDVVRAIAPNEDSKPVFLEVYRRSGHRTIQVYFLKETSAETKQEVLQALGVLGATHENANGRLYAIDLPPGVDFNPVADLLQQFGDKGFLESRYADQPQPKGVGEVTA